MAIWNTPSPYTEYNDLMKQAKRFEVVEDDDYKVTIDYENLTTTFEPVSYTHLTLPTSHGV